MTEKVYIHEHGTGTRPATVVSRYVCDKTGTAGERVVVKFTDEQGGQRDCFAKSIHASKEDAERSA